MVEIPGYDIRYTHATDLPYLKKWVSDPQSLQWLPMTTEKEIDDSLQCWIGFSRYSCSLTAMVGGVPCGIGTLFLMPYKKVAHHCVFKLIVDAKYRRQGIGGSLVKNLKHLAKNYFRLELLHIEVFEGNPIVSLLEKQGFSRVLKQDRYVKVDGRYLARILFEAKL